jgi:hypothetical protein
LAYSHYTLLVTSIDLYSFLSRHPFGWVFRQLLGSPCGDIRILFGNPTLANFAFKQYSRLESLFAPANLRQLTGLTGSGIRSVAIDKDNRFFRSWGDFLADFEGTFLVRYFGSQRRVTIENTIISISAGYFRTCRSLWPVRFAPGGRVLTFSQVAFEFCSSLLSICIPSSVATISRDCFRSCPGLLNVTFESDSKLSTLEESVFCECLSLRSVCSDKLSLHQSRQSPRNASSDAKICRVWTLKPVPKFQVWARLHFRSALHFARFVFLHQLRQFAALLSNLSSVPFGPGCELSTIGESAFAGCSSLESIYVPSSIETMPESCFRAANAFLMKLGLASN